MAKKRTGYDAVIQMHRDFLKLVTAYNAVGMFDSAAKAQQMAISLHEFEEAEIITNMMWPPRLVDDNGMKIIAPADPSGSNFGLHKDYR